MQIACACASASIAAGEAHVPLLVEHRLGHRVRERRAGAPATRRAPRAASCSASGSTRRLKKPQRSASSAPIERPGEQQLGGAALADDARQHRARAHVAAGEADAREQERDLRRAACRAAGRTPSRSPRPAPTQTPSIAAITGCGQPRIAFTRSPVMRVKRSRPPMSISVSGPMMSRTSPPEQKLPSAPGDHDGVDVVGVARARGTCRAARRRTRTSAGSCARRRSA